MTIGLVVTIALFLLKITHNLDITWWWVCAPVVIELALGLVFSVLVGTFTFRWFK